MHQPLFCYKTDLLDQILLVGFLLNTIHLYSLIFQVLTSRPCSMACPSHSSCTGIVRNKENRQELKERGPSYSHGLVHLKTSLRTDVHVWSRAVIPSSPSSTCLFLQLKNTGNLIQHFPTDWLHTGSCLLPTSPITQDLRVECGICVPVSESF